MANTLTGTPAAAAIYVQVRTRAALLAVRPCLAAVSVGAQPDDRAYLRSIAQAAAGCGVAVRPVPLPADCAPDTLTDTLRALSTDGAVHGVLLLRPLPEALRAQELLDTLDARKDVDGMTTASLGALVTGAAASPPARLRRVWPCCAHTGSTRRANAWPSSAGASSSAGGRAAVHARGRDRDALPPENARPRRLLPRSRHSARRGGRARVHHARLRASGADRARRRARPRCPMARCAAT